MLQTLPHLLLSRRDKDEGDKGGQGLAAPGPRLLTVSLSPEDAKRRTTTRTLGHVHPGRLPAAENPQKEPLCFLSTGQRLRSPCPHQPTRPERSTVSHSTTCSVGNPTSARV